MKKVHYKGHKASMPVMIPVGAKRRGDIKETLVADPYVELEDGDAEALCELDPHNFELAGKGESKPREVSQPKPAKQKSKKKKAKKTRAKKVAKKA